MAHKLGEVLLGKIGGYQPWPAKVVDPTTAPASAIMKQGRIMVQFFGSNDYRHLKLNEIVPYHLPQARVKNSRLQAAYEDAEDYLRKAGSGAGPSGTSVAPSQGSDATSGSSFGFAHAANQGLSGGSMRGQPPAANPPSPRQPRIAVELRDNDYMYSSDSGGSSELGLEDNSEPVSINRESPVNEDVLISDIVEAVHRQAVPRKRKIVEPSQWKKNKNKLAKSSGKPYVSTLGREVEAKKPLAVDCSNCRFKCSESFSEEQRQAICASYYELGDFSRQKDFILQHMPKRDIKFRKAADASHQREAAYEYNFNAEPGDPIRICQRFFLRTLGLKQDTVLRTARQGRSEQGHFVGSDRRGRHTPANKTPEDDVQHVREHISSFPVMESHYRRRSSSKQYLPSDLNRSKMYHLYKQWAADKGLTTVVGQQLYSRILNRDFNLGFFTPNKDQCAVCVKKETLTGDELIRFTKEVYQPHRNRHELAQKAKAEDKREAAETVECASFTFDLQSVLYTPCSDVSLMYYKRKLCVYNFTIYDETKPNDGYCYLWTECEAKRGANEIGSSLIHFLRGLPASTKRVSTISDTCGGQNRNIYVAVGLLHCVCTHPTLEVIDQKFLESSHTYMEVDSMHSAIEFAKKNQRIYCPHEWENVIVSARRSNPYKVDWLTQDKILDLKSLSQLVVHNRDKNTKGQQVSWMTTKFFRYMKAFPCSIFYKANFTDAEFQEIRLAPAGTRFVGPSSANCTPSLAYSKPLPISVQKKDDLLAILKAGIIPAVYSGYYQNFITAPSEEEL